jgi:hypothetical protein
MTAWTDFATKFFNDKRKTNKSYKFKHALKDASKIYKKHGKTNKKHRMRGGQSEMSNTEDKEENMLDHIQNGGKQHKNKSKHNKSNHNKSKHNKSNKNKHH